MGSSGRRVLVAVLLAGAVPVLGQGCSQCRDTVAQTNPAVQASYRVAIGMMMAAAGVVGGASFWVLRRAR